jgi:hypothetical protein
MSAAQQEMSEAKRLQEKLPKCSVLYEELKHDKFGTGTEETYMEAMRNQGVARAVVVVSAERNPDDHVKNPKVVRTLYYREFDAADAQVTDTATLSRIRESRLEQALTAVAIERLRSAPFFAGREGSKRSYKHWTSNVELFSSAWLPEPSTILVPSREHALSSPTPDVLDDVIQTRALLSSHNFNKSELNRALFDAVLSRYDNAAVIKLLLDAGADVNAVDRDGITPLMNAVDHQCNLRALLEHGAEVHARDKWGVTALKRAESRKQNESERLLKEAGATQ